MISNHFRIGRSLQVPRRNHQNQRTEFSNERLPASGGESGDSDGSQSATKPAESKPADKQGERVSTKLSNPQSELDESSASRVSIIPPSVAESKRTSTYHEQDQHFAEVLETETFLQVYVEKHFLQYRDHIRIHCQQHMTVFRDLRAIGNMPEKAGTKACQRLLSAPVVGDEVGHHLWQTLAKMVNGERYLIDMEEARAKEMEQIAKECQQYFERRNNGAASNHQMTSDGSGVGNGEEKRAASTMPTEPASTMSTEPLSLRGGISNDLRQRPKPKPRPKSRNEEENRAPAPRQTGDEHRRRWTFPFTFRHRPTQSDDRQPDARGDMASGPSSQRRVSMPAPSRSRRFFSNILPSRRSPPLGIEGTQLLKEE